MFCGARGQTQTRDRRDRRPAHLSRKRRRTGLSEQPRWLPGILLLLGLLALPGCVSAPDATARPGPAAGSPAGGGGRAVSSVAGAASSAGPAAAAAASSGAASAGAEPERGAGAGAGEPEAEVDTARYPWLHDGTCAPQEVTAPLASRFAPPAGLRRAEVEPGSFGGWLRGLPLRPPGAVVDYRGRTILAAGDPRLAAVVALDEGKADLQQCADSIIRLHAEWLWSKGERAIRYRAASGAAMPLASWLAGSRPAAEGNALVWRASARPVDRDDHGAFRKYLDAVFTWANTGALARDAAKVELSALRPGDFFVLAGSPGHAVLVLDVAVGEGGRRAALLGQGYMPAQSFHVLRSSADEAWFVIDPAEGGVETPFWPAPFPWSSLRRLDG